MGDRVEAPVRPAEAPADHRFDSWKEIAAYLKREVRTVQRWEKSEGLPVHRHEHASASSIYAFKSELDTWWASRRPPLEPEHSPDTTDSGLTQPSSGAERPTGAQEAPKRAVMRRAWLIAALATTLLIAVVVGYIIKPSPRPGTNTMLLVVPFANWSGDPQQDHMSDGLTGEMITQLGRLHPQQLGVIAQTTSMLYKGTKKSAREIGDELGVQYILEGAVRREGNRVRISANLVQVRDQSTVWAENYDRDLQDILKLQAEVAEAITRQILVQVSGTREASLSAEGVRSVNPEAYDKYLWGRVYWDRRDLARSMDSYNQAIAHDPSYALAYAGLAKTYVLLGSTPVDAVPPVQAKPQAKNAATRALQLDPKLDDAHLALANTYLSYDWDWRAAESEFKTALELNPSNPTSHEWYGDYLMVRGRMKEALVEMERARDLDPRAEIINSASAEAYYFAREYDRAIEQCRRALEFYPNSLYLRFWLGSAYREKKMYPEAIAAFSSAKADSGNNPATIMALGYTYGVSGNTQEAQNAVKELKNLARKRYVPALYFAAIYFGLGDKDKAFEWLEKAYAERTDRLIYLNIEPMADGLRSDPRFKGFVARVGLAPSAAPQTSR